MLPYTVRRAALKFSPYKRIYTVAHRTVTGYGPALKSHLVKVNVFINRMTLYCPYDFLETTGV